MRNFGFPVAFALLVGAGCGGEVKEPSGEGAGGANAGGTAALGGAGGVRASLAEGCVLNGDCDTPLVCAYRRCHIPCESSRDCATDQRCMTSDRPLPVCQLPDERTCAYNSDCPESQICGVDGQCREECASDRDCVTGQVCVSRTCQD